MIHVELMNQVGNKAIHVSNTYEVQIEPLHFEWDKFTPTLEKEFLDTLNKMLNHNSQCQPLNSNENRSFSHGNWKQYNSIRQEINNRMRTLKTPSPTISHIPNNSN